MSLHRRDDVPFIGGHDDFYYESLSGKKFIDMGSMFDNNKFYKTFDDWFNEQVGYAFRSEYIMDCIEESNKETLVEYLKIAWEMGSILGYEEGSAGLSRTSIIETNEKSS